MNKENSLPKRKATRLKLYDYGSVGAYFLTLCTQNRMNILSEIPDSTVGEGSPLPFSSYAVTPRLLLYGKTADKWINKIPEKYNNISVDCYVIMPNHIHLLLSVLNRESGRGDPSPTKETAKSIESVVGWLKYQITKEINKIRNTTGEKIFQRSFYDHVIRDREDYDGICRYIYENPMRWSFDELYF